MNMNACGALVIETDISAIEQPAATYFDGPDKGEVKKLAGQCLPSAASAQIVRRAAEMLPRPPFMSQGRQEKADRSEGAHDRYLVMHSDPLGSNTSWRITVTGEAFGGWPLGHLRLNLRLPVSAARENAVSRPQFILECI